MFSRMHGVLLLVATLVCGACSKAEAPSAPAVEVTATGAALCAKSWIDGVDDILSILHPDTGLAKEVRAQREVLANASLATSVPRPEGQYGIVILSEPSNVNIPWIILVPICKKDAGAEQLNASNFAAGYYDDINAIGLDSTIQAPRLIQGLILIHEMRHFWQVKMEPAPENLNQIKLRREVDAYELEFSILDNLQLPGYDQALAIEIERLRRAYAQSTTTTVSPEDMPLELLFPDISSNQRVREQVATMLSIRAHFKLLEMDSDPVTAQNLKIELMTSLGYK